MGVPNYDEGGGEPCLGQNPKFFEKFDFKASLIIMYIYFILKGLIPNKFLSKIDCVKGSWLGVTFMLLAKNFDWFSIFFSKESRSISLIKKVHPIKRNGMKLFFSRELD